MTAEDLDSNHDKRPLHGALPESGGIRLPQVPLAELEREFLQLPNESFSFGQLRLLARLYESGENLRNLTPALRGSVLIAAHQVPWHDLKVAQCVLKTKEALELKELSTSCLLDYVSFIRFFRGNCAPLSAELQKRAANHTKNEFVNLCCAAFEVGALRPDAVEIIGDRLAQHMAHEELNVSDAARLLPVIFRKNNSFGIRTRDLQREVISIFHAAPDSLSTELCLKAIHSIGSRSHSLINRLAKRLLWRWEEDQTALSLRQATAAFSGMVHAEYMYMPLEAKIHRTFSRRMSELDAQSWASLYAGYASVNWTDRVLAKCCGPEVLGVMEKLYPWELMRCAWAAAVFDERTHYEILVEHLLANYADFKSKEWQKVVHAGVALGVEPPRKIYDLAEEKGTVQSSGGERNLATPIAHVLSEMGIGFKREERHLWYSVDIVVPGGQFGSDKQVAIEADGVRFHYLSRGRTLSARTPLGKEVVKDKVLSRAYAVVHITDSEWGETQDKKALLRSRILKALGGGDAGGPANSASAKHF